MMSLLQLSAIAGLIIACSWNLQQRFNHLRENIRKL